ncbi:golgin subfamily A member 6-like protein 1 [Montipora capricornis]|uniref:golgin subfamily A member 6-like protein 1 n=1 Tax=Montipora capricornis TaxID=246305 RepID=UPI0035F1B50B
MAAVKEASKLEPGEIVPIHQLLHQINPLDELEPGEIRPNYVPYPRTHAPAHVNSAYGGVQFVAIQQCWSAKIQPGIPVARYVPAQQPAPSFQAPVTNSQQKKIQRLEELLKETKDTLQKEREDFSVKLKKQSKKIKDLEAKDKFQKNKIKELKEAKALAEDMWKKTTEEKDALSAMMQSMEKEGCKMARLLKAKEDSLSKAESKIIALELDNKVLQKEKHEADNEIARLKAECEKVACYRSAYEKTAMQLKRVSKQSEERKHEIEKICEEAEEEKATLFKKIKSLTLKCSRREKIIENEKAAQDELQKTIESDKAVRDELQKIIENEKEAQDELVKENKSLKEGLRNLQKETELLSQQIHYLQEQNHHLRKYSGVKGRFRRVRHFFSRVSERVF